MAINTSAVRDYRLGLLASFGACITSLEAPENTPDITDQQWEEIEDLYMRLLRISTAASGGS